MIKTKQDRILNTFDEMFPDARCVLNHSNNLGITCCSNVISTNNR